MSLLRNLKLLQILPRAPRKKDTATLKRELAADGYDVSQRTIQRDLKTLSGAFALVNDEDHKPYGWSWVEGTAPELIPGMDPQAALAFRLIELQLADALPPSSIEHLRPWFNDARGQLRMTSKAAEKAWPDRVRVISRAQPLVSPEVKKDVSGPIYEAVYLGRQIEAVYQGREDQEPKESTLNPFGLVLRDGVTFLICTYWDFKDPRYLPLHRFLSAKMLETERKPLKGFNLDAYLQSGSMGFQVSDKLLKLKLRVTNQVARTLQETPLAEGQKVKKDGDQHAFVTVAAPDTLTLRGWILGYGEQIEVVEPKGLRGEMKERAEKLSEIYG